MDRVGRRLTYELVHALADKLVADTGLIPVIGCEIEFYLIGTAEWEDEDYAALQKHMLQSAADAGIPLAQWERERGMEQFEVSLSPQFPADTAYNADRLKQLVHEAALHKNLQADFRARPFDDRPGSGLHVHLHLEDRSGKSRFYKKDSVISNELKFSIGGLLAALPESMPYFAPFADSYRRFQLAEENGTAPTTVSWGANNRTVALRLPDIGAPYRHIEHRVPGADADISACLCAMLAGVHYGLTEKIIPPAQVYGDAGRAEYNLPRLPMTLEEGNAALDTGDILQMYFASP